MLLFFSLGRGKVITSGSGGIILTNSNSIANAIQGEYAKLKKERPWSVIRNLCEVLGMRLFIYPWLYWLPAQLPFLRLGETKFYSDFPMRQMDGVRGGFLCHWIDRLEHSNDVRRLMAKSFLDGLPPGTRVVRMPSELKTTYLRLPLMMANKKIKERLCALSEERGLGISPLYPKTIQEIGELKHHFKEEKFPGATKVAEHLVTLPLHYLLRQNDRRMICKTLEELNYVASKGELVSANSGLG